MPSRKEWYMANYSGDVKPEHKNKIVGILSVLFPTAKVYLFGSRARGTASQWSDIDIALDVGHKLEHVDVDEAKCMFVESNIPYKIEIVDFHSVSKSMQESIRQEGILWKS